MYHCLFLLISLFYIRFLFVLSSFSAIFYLHFSRVTGFSRISLVIRFVRIIFLSFISSKLCSSELHFGLSLYFGFLNKFCYIFCVSFNAVPYNEYYPVFFLLIQIRIKSLFNNYCQLINSN